MAEHQGRRRFLATIAAGSTMAAANRLASPAVAQNQPQLSWRLTSAFPDSLEVMQGAAEVFVKYVAEETDNKFKIRIFPAGKLAAPIAAADAVTKGKVEMAHTASSYYWGRDPTFALGTGLPFGLNARQMNAWMFEGGGLELMNEFYARFNIIAIPAGNSGCQMGGWWRKQIENLDDLKGKKMRVGGFAGKIVAKLGMIPVQMAGDDILPALTKGKLDAAEWVGPYDDEKLGLYKGAKNYYYPGWWASGPMTHIFINKASWDILPKAYQAIVTTAGAMANTTMLARYDAKNPAALKRLLRKGVQLRPFSKDIMEAAFAFAEDFYAETASSNRNFKRVFDNWKQFRADQYLWSQVAELGMDVFQAQAVNRS